MRLLFLSNLYPPHDIGGYEQWCQEVALHLRVKGHRVCVLTSQYRRTSDQDAEPDIVRTLYLEADVYYYRPWDFYLRRPSQERFNQRTLKRIIHEMSPDVLLIWGMWNLSHHLPYWAEKWMPGRVAYYISSYWPNDVDAHTAYWQLEGQSQLAEWLKKPARALALGQLRREGYPPRLAFEHTMCCTQYVRDILVEASKLPSSASVLLGGIDPEPFICSAQKQEGLPDETLKLLFFGTLIPSKGVHTALEALRVLKQRGLGERVSLTILGSGHPDYEAGLHALVEDAGLQDRVHFWERVPRTEIPRWLCRFDVFLFTSIWAEPMGRTVMEAMAAGLLVIGTLTGGQREILRDGENALTFQAEAAVELANQVARVLKEPELRWRLARAGQQAVLERFTLDRMAGDMEKWLQGIVLAE